MKKAFLFFLLTSCALGPIYKTQYVFEEPHTSEERSCVVQCKIAQKQCSQSCEQSYRQCNSEAQRDYRMAQLEHKKNPELTSTPFLSNFTKSCTQDCECDSFYADCYSICGLEVQKEKVCVNNCK